MDDLAIDNKCTLQEQRTDLELASADLTGKTVVVTGANAGIGFEAAKHFAKMKPAQLILACRDISRANEAISHIRQDRETEGVEIVAWHLDLGSFSSVVAFANRFETEGSGRLDILIENAATSQYDFQKTQDGWEQTLQINVLSTALLALLLLPIQLKTATSGATPRLVMVSSDAHYLMGPFEGSCHPKFLEKLNHENSEMQSCKMKARYVISKLLILLFTRSLVARLPSEYPLTIVSVNPGLCRSGLTRKIKGIWKYVLWFLDRLVARTAEMGSRTLVWAALSGEKMAFHGRYLGSCRVSEESDWVLGKDSLETQECVWTQCIEILRKVSPKVDVIVKEYLTAK